jgi:hypothetical protein
MPFRPRTYGDGDGEPAQLSVNGTDRTYRARSLASIRRPARVLTTLPSRHCDRTFTLWELCASNMNSKPRRAAALGAAAISFVCRRHRATLRSRLWRCSPRARTSREVPAVLFIGGYRRRLLVPPSSARIGAAGFESGVRLGSRRLPGEPFLANVPDALTRHNRNLSPSTRPS